MTNKINEKKKEDVIHLPDDIFQYIIQFLPLKERVYNVSLVSKNCYNFVYYHCPTLSLNSKEIVKQLRFIDKFIKFIQDKFSKSGFSFINSLRIEDFWRAPSNDDLECLFTVCSKLKDLEYIDSKYLKCIEIPKTSKLNSLSFLKCKNLSSISFGSFEIEKLDLSGTNVGDDIFKEIEKLKDLKYLILKACMNLKNVIVKNQKLIRLNLRNCPNIKELNIESCINLTELNLYYTNLNDWDLLTTLQPVAKQLTFLELRGAKKLTFYDQDLLYNCKNLTSLNLCKTFVDDKFVKTITCLEKLYLLDLSWCPNIKKLEFDNMKKLTHLFFDYSQNLCELSIKNCPRLLKLNISQTGIEEKEKFAIYIQKELENLEVIIK